MAARQTQVIVVTENPAGQMVSARHFTDRDADADVAAYVAEVNARPDRTARVTLDRRAK